MLMFSSIVKSGLNIQMRSQFDFQLPIGSLSRLSLTSKNKISWTSRNECGRIDET